MSAGHDHAHGMAKQTLRLAFFLTLIIVAAEVIGGLSGPFPGAALRCGTRTHRHLCPGTGLVRHGTS